MSLIDEIKNSSEVVIHCADLNEIIESEQVEDWLQLPCSLKKNINLKLNENNYCTLIVIDAKNDANLNGYLSDKALAKENKSIS